MMKSLPFIRPIALTLLLASSLSFAADDHGGTVKPEPYAVGKTMSKAIQASITPDAALDILKNGNQRFATGKSIKRDYKKQIMQTGLGQYPFASVVACIDSRSAPELVFNQGIGDLFVARVAGNVINEDILGSLEYAAKAAGSKVIVVLGHTQCGAIKGACDAVQLGNLTGLLDKIKPAVEATKTSGERSSKNHEFVQDVAHENVNNSVQKIREMSPLLKEMEEKGQIKIVGAMYDVGTGKVTW
ncbi:carbonic anhydrase family protein [Iodobacter sp. LRB]|uniref:carbonic anhydrase family protein n=1 Tax=unclassified Iodobacter TaxID=235634 RepID=UPI001C557785|nr:carbonic anhydrase family protein [Iodobacter sp. BJB302]